MADVKGEWPCHSKEKNKDKVGYHRISWTGKDSQGKTQSPTPGMIHPQAGKDQQRTYDVNPYHDVNPFFSEINVNVCFDFGC